MLKRTILAAALLLIMLSAGISQVIQKPDSVIPYEKAKYLKEDLTAFLCSKVKYSEQDLVANIQGDVVLSFVINKYGLLDSLKIVMSPDNYLSASAVIGVNSLSNDWSPAKINNVPVNRKYMVIFRFRIYYNTRPTDYRVQADKFLEKQKYDRALKVYNKEAQENPYNHELFALRSKVKELLGDQAGAKKDQLKSQKLKDEIMSVININAILVSRTVTREIGSEIRKL